MRDSCNSVVSLLLVAALVSLPLGCSRATNEAMAKDVQGKISSDPGTKDSKVSVEAKDGKITLSGSVQSQAAQAQITNHFNELAVLEVDAQLRALPAWGVGLVVLGGKSAERLAASSD